MHEAATLTPAQKRRYARQVLLREFGEAGQLRLCATQARLPSDADPRAAAVAADYLARAGLAVGDAVAARELQLPDRDAVRALAGSPSLEQAASALCGAFAAVEAIKAALGVGASAKLPAELQLGRSA